MNRVELYIISIGIQTNLKQNFIYFYLYILTYNIKKLCFSLNNSYSFIQTNLNLAKKKKGKMSHDKSCRKHATYKR